MSLARDPFIFLLRENMEEGLKVNALRFYTQYYGHSFEDLVLLKNYFRSIGRRIIWLIGDSSLDNKHWLFEEDKNNSTLDTSNSWCAEAINGYENIFNPPHMIRDVCYWINTFLIGTDLVCINTAVEESCLKDAPSAHDYFVLSHMKDGDVIIASIGGNDLILKPSSYMIAAMGLGNYLIPQFCLETALDWLPNPLFDLFSQRTQEYVDIFLQKNVKRIVCTPYYPCANGTGWASRVLSRINMDKAQTVIRFVHENYHMSLKNIDAAIPLYEALDYQNETDYKFRVEPSVQGGHKIAERIMASIIKK
jgi:hypothetical protein